jgi:hypothetical protein
LAARRFQPIDLGFQGPNLGRDLRLALVLRLFPHLLEMLHLMFPTAWKPSIVAGRLLLLSPFEEQHRRITAHLAALRNRFVAETAAEICRRSSCSQRLTAVLLTPTFLAISRQLRPSKAN